MRLLSTILLAAIGYAGVGFQQVQVADPPGKPIAAAIWYSSNAEGTSQVLWVFRQEVAVDAAIAGGKLPVILVSHGVAGSLASHYDTAIALAKAGFIAVALTYTGDNGQDQSNVGRTINLIDRPRQLERVIRFVVDEWSERAHVDASRMGVYGFSLGGFTALVEIGGIPRLDRMRQLCMNHPKAPECDFVRQRNGDPLAEDSTRPLWVHDPRIRAAVVAAPAVSYLFEGDGLKDIKIPVQMWRGTEDQQVPDEWNTAEVRRQLSGRVEEHVVEKANHYAFITPCNDALRKMVPSICEDAAGFDRAAFHADLNREVVAFFWRTLSR